MREFIRHILREELSEQKKSKWNIDNLKDIALKYKTANEFKKNDYAAYQAAHKYGVFDEITKHMVSQIIRWTKDMV